MPEKSLDILINTHGELAGAKQVATELEVAIGKAKALGKEYGDLERRLALVKESISRFEASHPSGNLDDAIEKTGKKFEETGEHINSARLRGEMFRRVMMSIGQYTPGLEYAVMGGATAFGAMTAGAIGGGIALEKLMDHFKRLNEQLDQMAERAAQRDWLPGIEAYNSALEAGVEHNLAFQLSLDDIAKAAKKPAEELQGVIDKINELATARAGLMNAQLGLKIAQVNLSEKLGRISPEQAELSRFSLQRQFEYQQEQERKRAEQAQLNAQSKALEQAKARQPELQQNASAAESAYASIDAKLAKVEADIRTFSDNLKKQDKSKLTEALAKATEKFNKEYAFNPHESGFGVESATGRARRAMELAQSELNVYLKQEQDLRESRQRRGELKADALRLQDAQKSAEQALTENTAFIAKGGQAFEEAKASTAQKQAFRAGTQRLTGQAGLLNEEGRLIEIAKAQGHAAPDFGPPPPPAPNTKGAEAALNAMHQKLSELLQTVERKAIQMTNSIDATNRRMEQNYQRNRTSALNP